MKILLIALITILFSGCNTSMTPKEIAQAIKDCEDNGLEPKTIINGFSYEVSKVVCYQKRNRQ